MNDVATIPANAANRAELISALHRVVDEARAMIGFYESLIITLEATIESVEKHR
jgi:hypothetical protein